MVSRAPVCGIGIPVGQTTEAVEQSVWRRLYTAPGMTNEAVVIPGGAPDREAVWISSKSTRSCILCTNVYEFCNSPLWQFLPGNTIWPIVTFPPDSACHVPPKPDAAVTGFAVIKLTCSSRGQQLCDTKKCCARMVSSLFPGVLLICVEFLIEEIMFLLSLWEWNAFNLKFGRTRIVGEYIFLAAGYTISL